MRPSSPLQNVLPGELDGNNLASRMDAQKTCTQVSSVADTLLGAPGDARELGALAASPGLRIPGVLLARGVFEGSGYPGETLASRRILPA